MICSGYYFASLVCAKSCKFSYISSDRDFLVLDEHRHSKVVSHFDLTHFFMFQL